MSDKINMSAWHDNKGGYGVHISIEDSNYRILYRGDMTMTDFARAITQHGNAPIERELFTDKGESK